jgi:quercetin dioxygenase-like cupin family protein
MKLTIMLFSGLLLASATAAHAQSVTRTDLVKEDIRIPGYEFVQSRVTVAPGFTAPMHTHPGEEVAHVLQGEFEYRLGDRAPVRLKAGESLFIPAGMPHSAKNVGIGDAVELATYVVEKGKPLSVQK